MRGFRAALGFLTPVPSGAFVPDAATVVWLPVVGALVGGGVGAVWWAAGEGFPVLVAAALAVGADIALTGALHLDGLADAADGVLAHLDGPPRRLAVMQAPDVGAFGVVAIVVALLLRWSAFGSLAPDVALIACLWSASRAAMGVALVSVPYVGGGLASAFLGGRRGPVLGAGLLLPLALSLVSKDPAVAVVAVLGSFAAAAGVVALCRRRLGGVTGDVLGAAGVVAETAGLLVATAHW